MLSYLRSLFSHTSRRSLHKQSKHFSSKPLNTTTESTPSAFEQAATQAPERIQKNIDKVQIVGSLKESSRQMISSLLSLSILLMNESVQYLKVKTLTLKQRTVECMQQISLVTSKSKAFMLQTIWMTWKSTSLKKSDTISSYETLSSWLSSLKGKTVEIDLDGTLGIQYYNDDLKKVILSKHEHDLVKRISQELRLEATPTSSLEQILMADNNQSGTQLDGKNASSNKHDWNPSPRLA